jgi:hypothetical protein
VLINKTTLMKVPLIIVTGVAAIRCGVKVARCIQGHAAKNTALVSVVNQRTKG